GALQHRVALWRPGPCLMCERHRRVGYLSSRCGVVVSNGLPHAMQLLRQELSSNLRGAFLDRVERLAAPVCNHADGKSLGAGGDDNKVVLSVKSVMGLKRAGEKRMTASAIVRHRTKAMAEGRQLPTSVILFLGRF